MKNHYKNELLGFYESEIIPGVTFSMIDTSINGNQSNSMIIESNNQAKNSIEFAFVFSGEAEITATSDKERLNICVLPNTTIINHLPHDIKTFTIQRNVPIKMLGISISLPHLREILHLEDSITDTDILPLNEVMPIPLQQKASITQLFTYKKYGSAYKLFIQGKAIELFSMKIHEISSHSLHYNTKYKHITITQFEKNKIIKARSIQKKMISSPPSLQQLAILCGLSLNKIKKGFLEVYGKTPFDCLQEERMEFAYALLHKGHVNVSEAAWQVGYTHVGHFSSAFFKRFGIKPKELHKISLNQMQSLNK